MTRETVIVQSLSITRPAEVKNFQVIMPADSKKIIGVEFAAVRTFYAETGNYIDPEWWGFGNAHDALFQVKPNKTFGEFALQTLGTENIFFRGEMKDKDSNVFWADFSKPLLNQFTEWTHQSRHEEIEVNVNGGDIIECCYKDRLGIINAVFAQYRFRLYLWIEKNLKDDI